VEIIGRVTEDVPELRLRVIGRAQYRDEDFAYERRLHERVASDPRLRDKVTFDGYSDDVAASLGECHLLLHCRPDEPFGIVLIEAMSLGLPVVAPLGGGPCEIVDDGKTGRLFAPGDVEVAAAAVRELLTDRRRAAAMGTAGRERVCSHFSEVQLVEGFESLFTLLSGPL
jgi:glycosyltransferase involved in cell wall biosynthesis